MIERLRSCHLQAVVQHQIEHDDNHRNSALLIVLRMAEVSAKYHSISRVRAKCLDS